MLKISVKLVKSTNRNLNLKGHYPEGTFIFLYIKFYHLSLAAQTIRSIIVTGYNIGCRKTGVCSFKFNIFNNPQNGGFWKLT